MQIRHEKHHQAYITSLNAALKPYPELHDFNIEELLRRCNEPPVTIRQTVHNQGGATSIIKYFLGNPKARCGRR
jgi:Fe-Mn family superoxide dismutase